MRVLNIQSHVFEDRRKIIYRSHVWCHVRSAYREECLSQVRSGAFEKSLYTRYSIPILRRSCPTAINCILCAHAFSLYILFKTSSKSKIGTQNYGCFFVSKMKRYISQRQASLLTLTGWTYCGRMRFFNIRRHVSEKRWLRRHNYPPLICLKYVCGIESE